MKRDLLDYVDETDFHFNSYFNSHRMLYSIGNFVCNYLLLQPFWNLFSFCWTYRDAANRRT